MCTAAWSGALHAIAARAGDNMAMDITVNGEQQALPGPCTVLALLESKDLAGRKVAVEVNGAIVPRSLHAEHALKAGDRIEIVHALGGG